VLGQGSGGGCWADALRAARGWARAEGGKQRSWASAEEWASGSGSWVARLLGPKTEKGKEKILIKLIFYFLKHIFKTNSNSNSNSL